MKKIILMTLALASCANATEMACNPYQGFTVGATIGFSNLNGKITPSDFVGSAAAAVNTETSFAQPAEEMAAPNLTEISNDIMSQVLDYNSVGLLSSQQGINAGINLGWKTLMGCGKYSGTISAFIGYNGAYASGDIGAFTVNSTVNQVPVAADAEPAPGEGNWATWEVGSTDTCMLNAETIKVQSGLVYGLQYTAAKEYSWGSAGFVVGVKLNQLRLKAFEADTTNYDNGDAQNSIQIADGGLLNASLNDAAANTYTGKTFTKTAVGFTMGFTTNYYISDNLSAGMTVSYDIYGPVTFNLSDIPVCSYTVAESDTTLLDSGKLKVNNLNSLGVNFNLTYYFGSN